MEWNEMSLYGKILGIPVGKCFEEIIDLTESHYATFEIFLMF